MNKRLTVMVLAFVLVGVGLLLSNKWLSVQIDELSHISSPIQNSVQAQHALKMREARAKEEAPDLVKIDPTNDPLAPVDTKKRVKDKTDEKRPVQTRVIYDNPPKDLVLPQ